MNTNFSYSITTPSKEHIDGLQKLWSEAFGDSPHFIGLYFNTAYAPNRCLIALSDDKVVGSLYWFDCEYREKKIAYLYAIATAKDYQRMGICHTLMQACHKHLAERNYSAALLVPGNDDLFSFYRTLGYEVCSTVHEFTCMAKKGNIDLQPLTPEQYNRLRRKFLPANGIIQENENLAFLNTYARFYVGSKNQTDTFLLAADKKNDVLHGIELLGDCTNTPLIVQALGCKKGMFRAPGGTKNFAMYYPLDNNDIIVPLYFGIAHD